MKGMILRYVFEWAADYLTKERVEEWEQAIASTAIPILESKLDLIVVALRAKASLSETKIDDTVVDGLEALGKGLIGRLKD